MTTSTTTKMKTRTQRLLAAAMLAGLSVSGSAIAQDKPAPEVKDPKDDAGYKHLTALMELASKDRSQAFQQTLNGLEKTPTEYYWGLELSALFQRDEIRGKSLTGEARSKFFTESYDFLSHGKELVERELKKLPHNESLSYQAKAINGSLAIASLEAGKTAEAKRLAQEQLDANTATKDWNYGNVVHQANSLLGRAALREGDRKAAAEYLMKAGQSPGSPQLNSFGPDFTFAREMLEAGETKAVLEYLDLVEKFWVQKEKAAPLFVEVSKRNKEKLDHWRTEIRAGVTPRFEP